MAVDYSFLTVVGVPGVTNWERLIIQERCWVDLRESMGGLSLYLETIGPLILCKCFVVYLECSSFVLYLRINRIP